MISVVIPALNERYAIAQTVKRVASFLVNADLQPFEIVVVMTALKTGPAS
jgi:glycosyltransferase involved in cell wall biosynthesis